MREGGTKIKKIKGFCFFKPNANAPLTLFICATSTRWLHVLLFGGQSLTMRGEKKEMEGERGRGT